MDKLKESTDKFKVSAKELEIELNKFGSCMVDLEKPSGMRYQVNIDGEEIVVVFIKTARTTELKRNKAQVRFFWKKMLELIDYETYLTKRYFFFSYIERTRIELDTNNIDPHDYIVSLETNWKTYRFRPDITRIYHFIDEEHSLDFKTSVTSSYIPPILHQAAFFKKTVKGFKAMEGYLKSFDNRLLFGKDKNSLDMILRDEVNDNDFSLLNPEIKKKRINALINRRIGQANFRAHILNIYKNKCCVTEEKTQDVLEAAHIQPYKNNNSNNKKNGLLLRSDIHKLFDTGLMYIDKHYIVHISPSVKSINYRALDGKKISLPNNTKNYPSLDALALKEAGFIKE